MKQIIWIIISVIVLALGIVYMRWVINNDKLRGYDYANHTLFCSLVLVAGILGILFSTGIL